jgi:hypothetical protein
VNFKELRVGNWVLDEKDKLEKPITGVISKESINHVYFSNRGTELRPVENISGILLDHDVLTKFGFVDHGEHFGLHLPGLFLQSGGEIGWYMTQTGGYMNRAYPCKYVHQVQNLYFALTGEELIYTNTVV